MDVDDILQVAKLFENLRIKKNTCKVNLFDLGVRGFYLIRNGRVALKAIPH